MYKDVVKYDFLILAGKRTGSHMLATMLNSHLYLSCEGEFERENDTVTIHAREDGIQGCIIHYRQLRKVRAPKHIHLIRDPLDNAVSLARTVARQSDSRFSEYAAHYIKGDVPKNQEIVPDQAVVNARLHTIKRQRAKARAWFKKTGKNLLEVSYEDITGGRSVEVMPWKTGREICQFLGIPYRRMTTHFIKGTEEEK